MKEPNTMRKKLPGFFVRIISFIPVFNWIALIYIGKKCAHKASVILGIIYGTLTFAVPNISSYLWVAVIIQYAVTRRIIEKKYIAEGEPAEIELVNHPIELSKKSIRQETIFPETISESIENDKKSTVLFSEIIIEGEKEKTQIIQKKSVKSENSKEFIPQKSVNISYEYSPQNKFIEDMRKFADKSEENSPFVPYRTYWPTYDSMKQSQKAWYFYWRTEARNGNYLDTDLSYIFIYVYEILSGVGWNYAQDGYDKLMTIWMKYREKHPKLDHYLFAWSFDFAWLHSLEYIEPKVNGIQLPYQQTIKDILIDRHSTDRPLKLSFGLIDSLCDYSLTRSKFYKEGHQLLIQEAIPRVIALVDASLIKKKNQGILSLYAPDRTEKQSYILFQSAVCPDADKKIDISVKAYTSSPKLRGYINELVRFGENTLRAIYGCRGRLRGVTVEEETAILIEKFLKKEYRPFAEDKIHLTKAEVKLNFDSINKLRNQSDAVRNALEVSENNKEPKELLTDLEEVTSLLGILSVDARLLIDNLVKNKWETTNDSDKLVFMDEINMQANKYLACALLVLEQDLIVVEDDYRDELDYIFTNQLEISNLESSEQTDKTADSFIVEKLSVEMQQLIKNLTLIQAEILYAILKKESIQEKLEKAAEELMSMPEIMIDEINDLATQYLDDILIDTFEDELYVLEQYEEELKQAMK